MDTRKSDPEEGQGASASELIDARIDELSDWRGETLGLVRALIKQADPEVVEEWKWRGVPVWSHAGIICTGETYKNVVKMTFAKGASLEDPSGLFNSSLEGNTRRAIDFREGDKIDEEALKALIGAAVALNTAARAAAPSAPRRDRKAPSRRPAWRGERSQSSRPRRLRLQRARPCVLARCHPDQLDEIVAGAGGAVRAAGQDKAVLRRKDLDAAAFLAGGVDDGGEAVAGLHLVAGLHVIEDRAGARRGHHLDMADRRGDARERCRVPARRGQKSPRAPPAAGRCLAASASAVSA